MMADLTMKCAHCDKELLGDVYRVDQGSFIEPARSPFFVP